MGLLRPPQPTRRDDAGSFPVQASGALRAFPVPAGSKELRSQRPIRLLCLDGGGMRGVILIEMIRQIESIAGKKARSA
jgi:hypothetical protein